MSQEPNLRKLIPRLIRTIADRLIPNAKSSRTLSMPQYRLSVGFRAGAKQTDIAKIGISAALSSCSSCEELHGVCAIPRKGLEGEPRAKPITRKHGVFLRDAHGINDAG